MATSVAVDYSYARPGARTIQANGYPIVFRYLGTSRDGRAVQQPELDELHGAGLLVALVHQANQPTAELSVKRPLTGYAGGQEDARLGNLYADHRGAPGWLPIFTPVDVGFGFPAPEHYGLIRDFFMAHLDYSPRPVAAYGPYPVLEMLSGLRNGNGRRIEHFWQTAGASGSGEGSGGSIVTGDGSRRKLSRHACAFQHYGMTRIAQTDHNDVFTDARYWAWNPGMPPDAAIELEDLNMKAVYLPDEPAGEPKFWQPIDGLRRVIIEDPPGDDPAVDLAELAMLMEIGAVGPDAVTLTGMAADLFKRRYHPTDAHTVHWGSVKLMLEGVRRVTEALPGANPDAIRQAVADAIAAVPVQVNADVLADEIVGRLAGALEAAAGALGPG